MPPERCNLRNATAASEVVGRPVAALAPPQAERPVDPVKWLARWAAEPNFEHARFVDLMRIQVRLTPTREAGQTVSFVLAEGRFEED